MTKLTRKIEIGASREEVYAVLADPSCLAKWVTIQESLDEAPQGDLEQGAHVVQRLKVAGQRFRVRWTVSEAKHPSRIVWEGAGPLRTHARALYELTTKGSGTSFSYTNEYTLPGGPAGRILGRALNAASGREADRSLARLKRLIESR